MRDFLAEKLLVKIMEWTPEEISIERPLLQALASFKYNNYQQFSPGIRFIESLVRWLNQFEQISEKKIAYKFIKDSLIFISNEQMLYLVNIAFNDKINPIIIEKTAHEIGFNEHLVAKIINSEAYQNNLRKCLFIGLSDGSKIDYLRRSSKINNEQILTTHEISPNKVMELLEELKKSQSENSKFHTIFLVDDFTASGKSYFRLNEKKGKIWKFLNKIFYFNADQNSERDSWNKLVEIENLEVYILFYLASRQAINKIQDEVDEWKQINNVKNKISIIAIQYLDDNIKANIIKNKELISLVKKYYDSKIENRHYKIGTHELPYLGFNECSLPLVLSHNTPNNSLPILWLPEEMKYCGLFPRVTRHK